MEKRQNRSTLIPVMILKIKRPVFIMVFGGTMLPV